MLSHNATNFEAAIKYAKDVEVVFRTYNPNEKIELKTGFTSRTTYGDKNNVQISSKNNFKIKEDNNQTLKNSAIEGKPGPSGRRNNIKCNFSGKQGHMEAKCFKKQARNVNILQSKNEQTSENIPPDVFMDELAKALNMR